jgi:hypothetical protein
MVNENRFRFNRKIFFNFRKTMFDIRLSEFSNCRSSESNRARVRQHLVAGTLPATRFRLEYCRIPDKPAGSGQNSRDLAIDLAGSGSFRPEFGNGDRMLSDSGDICQTLIFAFCNFFVRTKH